MISQQTIDEIKNRADIVEVVGDFVMLKKSGQNYKALSPFTEEKTPSFFVSPSKGIYKCFSTGKGGDAISFVMEVDGLSYVESLRYLAGKFSIEIEEDRKDDEAYQLAKNEREALFIVLNFAKEYFVDLLWNHTEGKSIGLSYFKERGFSDDVIKAFDLGYSLDKWDDLLLKAKENQHSPALLEKSGLTIVKENKEYDRFRGRVMFPIHNTTGKVIAFGARILIQDKKQPKYVNSPETELYNKSNILYGIYQAKQTIRTEDNCYLVEGYTDVISLYQAGIKNVVASSGTSLTPDQIKLIKRHTNNITVLYDGDKAGIKASLRGIDLILEADLDVKAVSFPEGEDPDSYARKLNPSSLRNYIETTSKDFIQFKAETLLSDSKNDPIQRANTIKEIVQSIAKVPDAIKRNVYLQQCADLLSIDEGVLKIELNKIITQHFYDVKKDRNKPLEPTLPEEPFPQEDQRFDLDINDAIALQERESIRVLVNYCDQIIEGEDERSHYMVDYFLNESADLEFKNPVYKRIVGIFKEKVEKGELIGTDYLFNLGDEEIQTTVIDMMMARYEVSIQWFNKYDIYIPSEQDILKRLAYTNILRLKLRIVQSMVKENLNKLKQQLDDDKQNEVLREHQYIKSMEIEIAKELGIVTTGIRD